MDADGQHDPNDIPRLLDKLDEGYDMLVGARTAGAQARLLRKLANGFYNRLASLMTGFRILDLTAGLRAARAHHLIRFLYLLPNGFPYRTTITMAFFRTGLPVGFIPIEAAARTGKSHVRLLKDGVRFFVIIPCNDAKFWPSWQQSERHAKGQALLTLIVNWFCRTVRSSRCWRLGRPVE
jgi:hypothetical protein